MSAKDFRALLAAAKLPEGTVAVCLRGDLAAEFEDLDRQLQEALSRPADSLAGDGSGDLVGRMESLRDQMRDSTYTFRLRAMTRPRWRAFLAEHPPRRTDDGDVNERDRVVGVNTETVWPAMVRECLIDPVLDDTDWSRLVDESLTDKQFSDLSEAAWALNRGDVDIPFSPAASRTTWTSDVE